MDKIYDDIEDFANDFKGNLSDNSLSKLEKALERAYDIRKFEIEFYWKRAGYFWGFLVATFAGYFIVSDKTKFSDKPEYEFLVICLGFIFSLSWYLVNRGSKYWQTNWEKIIDTIEEKIEMPLYRINLGVQTKKIHIFKEHPYSVSNVNQIVSLFICFIWIALMILFFLRDGNKISIHRDFTIPILIISVITILAAILLWFDGESGKSNTKTYFLVKRFSEYKNKCTAPNKVYNP